MAPNHGIQRFNFDSLAGKTIATITQRTGPKFDDKGYLDITFTDGSSVCVIAGFDQYTGKSADEYPTNIWLADFGYERPEAY